MPGNGASDHAEENDAKRPNIALSGGILRQLEVLVKTFYDVNKEMNYKRREKRNVPGDMYTLLPIPNWELRGVRVARPKSVRKTFLRSSERRTFSGLMSRWYIPTE